MFNDISIWQYELLVIYEEKNIQKHFVCKNKNEADDLFDELVFKVYN